MENILSSSLNLIDDIINNTQMQNLDFYSCVTKKISSLYKDSNVAIFFCDNLDYSLKSAARNEKIIKTQFNLKEKTINDFLNSNKKSAIITLSENNVFYLNTFVVKLAVRNSVFGFMTLSSNNKIQDNAKKSFETIANVVSYKIKDFELGEVFKIQLKAMQDAITEKDNANLTIKKQHKKLQEIDKTKNMFLASISHELRTPLNAIIGFSQALDSRIFGDLNEKQAEYIRDIQISGLHLLGMINEILDISKLEAHAMKFSPVEINPDVVINEVISILEPLYKNKNLDVIFASNLECTIKADYQKFQQILYNLLSNAIKFTDKNGKIEVIQEIRDKNYILKIKDNGIGIAKKHHTKIFKKFVHLSNITAKNQSSTGLGLTITKELVKLHNGKITLQSELNKGSTFIMEFKNIVL